MKYCLSIILIVTAFTFCNKKEETLPPNNNEFRALLTFASGSSDSMNIFGEQVKLGCGSSITAINAYGNDDSIFINGAFGKCMPENNMYTDEFNIQIHISGTQYYNSVNGMDKIGSITFANTENHMEGLFQTTCYNLTNHNDSIKVSGVFKGDNFSNVFF